MNPITAILEALGRRKVRLDELQAQLAQLQADHEAALVRDDDESAAKLFARVEKTRLEIRAAEAAIESAKRQDEAKRRATQTIEQQRKGRERDTAASVAMDAGEKAERIALDLAQAVRDLCDAHEAHHEKACAAGTPGMHPGGLSQGAALNIIFFQLTSAMQRPGHGPVLIRTSGSRSRKLESIAERHRRYLADPVRNVSHPEPKEA